MSLTIHLLFVYSYVVVVIVVLFVWILLELPFKKHQNNQFKNHYKWFIFKHFQHFPLILDFQTLSLQSLYFLNSFFVLPFSFIFVYIFLVCTYVCAFSTCYVTNDNLKNKNNKHHRFVPLLCLIYVNNVQFLLIITFCIVYKYL